MQGWRYSLKDQVVSCGLDRPAYENDEIHEELGMKPNLESMHTEMEAICMTPEPNLESIRRQKARAMQ